MTDAESLLQPDFAQWESEEQTELKVGKAQCLGLQEHRVNEEKRKARTWNLGQCQRAPWETQLPLLKQEGTAGKVTRSEQFWPWLTSSPWPAS